MAFTKSKKVRALPVPTLYNPLFFRFLKREGWIDVDPTFLIESPKLWQLIPEVMTEKEVAALLTQPEEDSEIGARDRAILELLYATGIRVSELCSLNVHDVDDQTDI